MIAVFNALYYEIKIKEDMERDDKKNYTQIEQRSSIKILSSHFE